MKQCLWNGRKLLRVIIRPSMRQALGLYNLIQEPEKRMSQKKYLKTRLKHLAAWLLTFRKCTICGVRAYDTHWSSPFCGPCDRGEWDER